MKVVFRVDASMKIGTGHVMRCLTLAEGLKEKGVQVEFICREHEGNLIDFIRDKDFKVYTLLMVGNDVETSKPAKYEAGNVLAHASWLGVTQQQDADQCRAFLKKINPEWLIVDHYAIDKTWQLALKSTCNKLMVIDDLGDRNQICDLLLDQNYESTRSKYKDLVPVDCKILVGSSYALLRPEFAHWREFSLNRRLKPILRNILISLGGVDPDNYTGRILEALKQKGMPKDMLVTVVMGPTAPHLRLIQQQAHTLPYKTEIKVNVSNMAELMANADLSIGAAGATTWERCCLGLPSIQIVIAENQKKIAENLSKVNAIKYISNVHDIKKLIETALTWMQSVGQKASQVCDGMGTENVIKQLMSLKK